VRSCDESAEIYSEFKVYMRYSGQGWEIPISLTEAQAKSPDADTFLRLFEEDYVKLFGRAVDGMDIEITVWAVNATTPVEKVERIHELSDCGVADVSTTRAIFDPALGEAVGASVVLRTQMQDGQTVQGPVKKDSCC